jgi:hypothetical protein
MARQVRGKQVGYSAPLQVTCYKTPAGNSDIDRVIVNVFRADLQITNPDVSEENESTTGAYIKRGTTRTITIGIKDYLIPDTDIVTFTLSTSSNKKGYV